MRLVGIRSSDGRTSVAAVTPDGSYRELADLAAFWARPGAAWGDDGIVWESGSVDLVPPVLPGAKVICVGLNYRSHHAEGSFKDQRLPEFPTLFARWTSSLSVSGVPVPIPVDEAGLDWEGEIAAFIGDTLVEVPPDEGRRAVVAYAAFNDITARAAQKQTSQWILGKNADRSGPLGVLVTADEVGDLRDGLQVRTRVNGETVQDGNSRDMIYELGSVIAHISRTLTLSPGDVICTGTPQGVGYARNPPWLLGPGDIVEVEIERLGSVTTPVVAAGDRSAAVAG